MRTRAVTRTRVYSLRLAEVTLAVRAQGGLLTISLLRSRAICRATFTSQ